MNTLLLYIVTALAEIIGCYLPFLWLRHGRPVWLLIPAALSLALFSWLLTLHGTATGRVYAAYGGVYIGVAIAWLWVVDGVRPTAWDVAGSVVALAGMALIAFQPPVLTRLQRPRSIRLDAGSQRRGQNRLAQGGVAFQRSADASCL